MQVAVLISGRGSNLEALINAQNGYQISHVISDNFNAKGIKTAKNHGITNTVINWNNRIEAESMLCELLQEVAADLVVLAGFMRILSTKTLQAVERIINIHPSLLPKYPGLNTHQKVIDNQDKWHGATVHVVNEELDAGLILAQTRFAVDANQNANQLAAELITKEHKLLTTVVGLIAQDKLKWQHQVVYMNEKTCTEPLQINF